jgi:hypothetical protein
MAVAQPPTQVEAPPHDSIPGRVTYQPRIQANRRHIDDRFPSLGFTVDTGGHAFFEVLLATDSSLFAAANAAKRSDATFYTSRRDGGLLPASQAAHPFLVPSAVIRGFAAAVPRPSALFYTLIGYDGSDGSGPAFAHDPARLATSAPAVSIARDFTGNTLATVLSVSVHKLQRLGSAFRAPAALNGSADAASGEDGYGMPPPAIAASVPTPYRASEPRPPSIGPQSRPYPPDYGSAAGYQLAVLPGPEARPPQSTRRSTTLDPLLPGQDGTRQARVFGTESAIGQSQSTDFAADEPEPDYFADDEDERDYRTDLSLGALGEPEHGVGLNGHPRRYQSLDDQVAVDGRPIGIDDKMRIVDHIAPFESSGDYGAINPDGEFAGRFGTNHPAYGRYHVGLSYGIIQFTQDSGALGQLLVMMRDRDGAEFARCFGPDADRLIEVTTATGPSSSESPDGRSARVQPVAGADLWVEPWSSRFRAAGSVESFKAAQRELAAKAYLDPMLQFAGWMRLDTERALTIVIDRAVQMGVGGAKRWIASAVGPLAARAVQQQALAALGYTDLRSFQAATPGLTADGEWGPNTHAAMVAALRNLGSASPVPIPSTDQMVETLVHRAATEPWRVRIETLRSASMPDIRYQL